MPKLTFFTAVCVCTTRPEPTPTRAGQLKIRWSQQCLLFKMIIVVDTTGWVMSLNTWRYMGRSSRGPSLCAQPVVALGDIKYSIFDLAAHCTYTHVNTHAFAHTFVLAGAILAEPTCSEMPPKFRAGWQQIFQILNFVLRNRDFGAVKTTSRKNYSPAC